MKKFIPNALTFGNLFSGFLAIGLVVNGDTKNAVTFIFIALLFDALDGRAARVLGVTNNIGKELDSLADIVSFGVAPAILVAFTFYEGLGIYGLMLSGIFPLFGCYRLARFNVTPTSETLKHFTGVPITLAGGIVALMVFFADSLNIVVFNIIYWGLAYLMVSKVRIPSFKKVAMPKKRTLFMVPFMGYILYLGVMSYIHNKPNMLYVIIALCLIALVDAYFFKPKRSKNVKNIKVFRKNFKIKRIVRKK
ncbi:CDP-diacylglycerol--serine O-phosphatidyltransferase [Lysinibacillus xylanilyticus]|uniref:CDP-diacylglycerol--serine O-phosphatidyltransferase n=1 Tax=Lysinibacillus xylanilyticus TaxID=582475 RepID=UPI00380F6D37